MNIETQIENFILNELLVGDGRTKLDPEESLVNAGVIDSLGILQLIAFLEEEFNVTIDDSEVTPDNFETISVMKGLIERKLQVS